MYWSLASNRELGLLNPQSWRRDAQFSNATARKLRLERVLEGHTLCVNRLAWNQDGSRLASGSDDRRVMVWQFPDYRALPLALNTAHDCNIFAVQFLPCTGDRLIVSGAMDHTVQLHHLDVDPSGPMKYPSGSSAQGGRPGGGSERRRTRQYARMGIEPEVIEVDPRTTVHSCHRSRVKDVEVEPMNPHNFWSACEDGFIRQFDVRTGNQSDFRSQNVLIQVRGKDSGSRIELKGLDINKVKPHQMAIACGDAFIRIYDRRRLSVGGPSDECAEPLLKLSPPHLALCPGRRSHSTYVNFSNGGDQVVATYHGDHAYSFDVTGEGFTSCAFLQPRKMQGTNNHMSSAQAVAEHEHPRSSQDVDSIEVEEYLGVARSALDRSNFERAIRFFSMAIQSSPRSSGLYLERAHAYLKRRFVGDACFALRDCDQAILLDGTSPDAHFAQLQALKALNQLQTARALFKVFVSKFPELENSQRVKEFLSKLQKALSLGASKDLNKRKRRRQSKSRWLTSSPGEEEEEEETSSEDFEHFDIVDKTEEEKRQCQEDCLKYYKGECQSSEPGGTRGIWFGTQGGQRLLSRFIGHCNVQTDIKESVFLGLNDELVACGSDDGKVFIYEVATGQPIQVLQADTDVANCVQCHPNLSVLATSGLESVIRLWSPSSNHEETEQEMEDLVVENQDRMRAGPLGLFSPITSDHALMQMQLILGTEFVRMTTGTRRRNRGARGVDGDEEDDDDGDDDEDDDEMEGSRVNCRMS